MDEKQPAVYIIGNHSRSTLYVGVTSNLIQRIAQHKQSLIDGFAKRYRCTDLLYYEQYDDMEHAITREKQIKAYRREKKEILINQINPERIDLYKTFFEIPRRANALCRNEENNNNRHFEHCKAMEKSQS